MKTRAAVYAVEDSIDTLVELMAIYREKGTIFNKTCTLLGLLCNDPVRRRVCSVINDHLFLIKAVLSCLLESFSQKKPLAV